MRSPLGRVVFFAALLAIAVGLVLLRGGDGPPPDDADLMAAPAAPPDHENAFLTLTAAAALLDWPEDEAEAARLREIASGRERDDALATRTLAANERALEAFERAARQPAFRSPDRRTRPDLIAWLDLARLSGVRAISLARSGDAEASIHAALICLRVARLVGADSNGSVLVGTMAAAIGEAGLDALREVSRIDATSTTRTRELAGELADLGADPEAWRGLFSAEYRALAPLLPASPADVSVPVGERALALLAALLPDSHLSQPNNTRAAYAGLVRALRANAGSPCLTAPKRPDERVTFRSLLRPNAIGRQQIDRAIMASVLANQARCVFDTRVEALRAVLVVRAFERERGVLPPTLEALVPEYASTVPRDGFSGGPLRLDRDARHIVSIGYWDPGASASAREERFPLLPAPPAS